MKKLLNKIYASIFVFFMPLISHAKGLVPCGGKGEQSCSWNDIYTLFNKVINFLIQDIGIPLVVLAIVLGGVELVINRDKPTAKSVWKDRIQKAILGLVIILCAYLLVKVVVWGLTGSNPGAENSDYYYLRNQVKQ